MELVTTLSLRKLEDLSDLERMALVNMSYSRMDTYDMCPGRYFYTYVQKEPRVFGAAASLGNVLHGVLEDVVGGELDLDDMFARMLTHREKYDPDELIDEPLMDAGREMLTEFVDRHEDEKFDVIGKELPFELVIGSALVIGYIDLVTRDPDGTIRITDYKSGRYEVTFKAAPDNLQIGLYALAASLMFPDTPVYAELYYLRSGRRKGHLFTPDDLGNVYERVLEKIQAIINDRNFKFQPGQPCSFCDFAKSGICPAAKSYRRY